MIVVALDKILAWDMAINRKTLFSRRIKIIGTGKYIFSDLVFSLNCGRNSVLKYIQKQEKLLQELPQYDHMVLSL